MKLPSDNANKNYEPLLQSVAMLLWVNAKMFWLLIISGDYLWDWVEQDRKTFVRYGRQPL